MTVAIHRCHVDGRSDKAVHNRQGQAFELAVAIEKNYKVRKRPK